MTRFCQKSKAWHCPWQNSPLLTRDIENKAWHNLGEITRDVRQNVKILKEPPKPLVKTIFSLKNYRKSNTWNYFCTWKKNLKTFHWKIREIHETLKYFPLEPFFPSAQKGNISSKKDYVCEKLYKPEKTLKIIIYPWER